MAKPWPWWFYFSIISPLVCFRSSFCFGVDLDRKLESDEFFVLAQTVFGPARSVLKRNREKGIFQCPVGLATYRASFVGGTLPTSVACLNYSWKHSFEFVLVNSGTSMYFFVFSTACVNSSTVLVKLPLFWVRNTLTTRLKKRLVLMC